MRGLFFSSVLFLLLALASLCYAVENEHELCCKSCLTKFYTIEMRMSCMHGCRLYAMIYLAHDPSVAQSETASLCSKSCTTGAGVSAAKSEACAAGCANQDRAFREHHLDGHTAKLAVLMGLARPPIVHSPRPQHWRLFDRAWPQQQQQEAAGRAWLHAVRIRIHPLPMGPDGRPRYLVQIAEHAIPLRLLGHSGGLDNNNGQPLILGHSNSHHVSPFARYWFGDSNHSVLRYKHLSHRTRSALRWAACGLLLASLIGMLWLCCSLARSIKRRRNRVLRGTLIKRLPPSIQSGDILIEKKQPIFLSDTEEKKAVGGAV